MEIRERIEKDIAMFKQSVEEVKKNPSARDGKILEIVKLSEMYASDSRSYLDKGDLYTSFSCISYAHGLLDAVKAILR